MFRFDADFAWYRTYMIPVVIDANLLATWLAKDAANVWWTVDGEDVLAGELDLPVTGSHLAEAVRKHGGELLLFSPHHASPNGARDIGSFADSGYDGARIFQLAWKSEPDHPWLIAEDVEAARAAQ